MNRSTDVPIARSTTESSTPENLQGLDLKAMFGVPEEAEQPYQLPQELIEPIRAHLEEDHGLTLDLDRDVAWEEHEPAGAFIEAEPASVLRGARYYCAKCKTTTIVSDPIHGPLRNAMLLRKHEALRVQTHGIEDQAELDATIEAWDRGELAPQINRERLRKASQRAPQRRRERDARRREGCQGWMLKRRAEIGHVETVVAELHAQLKDPAVCWEITGGNRVPAEETLAKYWSATPIAKRNASKAAYMRKPEAERRAIEKARRLGELPPPGN